MSARLTDNASETRYWGVAGECEGGRGGEGEGRGTKQTYEPTVAGFSVIQCGSGSLLPLALMWVYCMLNNFSTVAGTIF